MTWGRVKDIVMGFLLVAVLVLGVAVLVGYHRQSELTQRLNASVHSPTHTHDIALWCGFDTALKVDLTVYLAGFHAPALPLPPLDCAQIEHQQSAAAGH